VLRLRTDPVDLDLKHTPVLPDPRDHPIGVIGAGFIVADVQLHAYRDAGYVVQAIASRTPGKAQSVAAAHEIPRVYDTWIELLDDASLQVIDIAFPPDQQAGIIEAACEREHIRGILAQKPLATSYPEARHAVERCEAAGKLLAVNQNMRYDQSIRALKTLLLRGDLGEPVLATIELRTMPHPQTWIKPGDRFVFANLSIHHVDTFRCLFGDPDGIFVSARPEPRTESANADGIVLYILEYESGLRASAWDDIWAGPDGCENDIYIKWRVEGTEGLAWGTIGWPFWPVRTPSTLSFATVRRPGYVFNPRWREVWFPDAFQGTMGELLGALNGADLSISGRDNLTTIALIDAGYRSIAERRLVRVEEIVNE
jgi:predicted dehydrogenase